MSEIKKGVYRHYKGNLYRVIGTGKHSETLEEFVVYQPLYENEFSKDAFWIRPRDMFLEEIEINGERKPRFEYQKDDVDIRLLDAQGTSSSLT